MLRAGAHIPRELLRGGFCIGPPPRGAQQASVRRRALAERRRIARGDDEAVAAAEPAHASECIHGANVLRLERFAEELAKQERLEMQARKAVTIQKDARLPKLTAEEGAEDGLLIAEGTRKKRHHG